MPMVPHVTKVLEGSFWKVSITSLVEGSGTVE